MKQTLFEQWGIGPEVRKGGLITLFALLVGMLLYSVSLYDAAQEKNGELSNRILQVQEDCARRQQELNEKRIEMLREALERQQAIEAKLKRLRK